jgi:hypothetical protein
MRASSRVLSRLTGLSEKVRAKSPSFIRFLNGMTSTFAQAVASTLTKRRFPMQYEFVVPGARQKESI